MASRRFQQTVTVPTTATLLSTLLTNWPAGVDFVALELGMQVDSSNTGIIRWGASTVSTTNGMELAEYTERVTSGETVQIDNLYVVSSAASQKINVFARI